MYTFSSISFDSQSFGGTLVPSRLWLSYCQVYNYKTDICHALSFNVLMTACQTQDKPLLLNNENACVNSVV